MKIREVRAQNLRNFGPDAPAVSFVDPDTHQVRPLTILVGANGSGKTTLLELIEAMCWYSSPHALRELVQANSKISLTMQYPDVLRHPVRSVILHGYGGSFAQQADIVAEFPKELADGLDYSISIDLLHFPSLRALPQHSGGMITSPSSRSPRIYRYSLDDSWTDSLEALWIWQNYLDLEAQADGHPNLLPFVETIQTILGKNQTIKIQRGNVWVERPHLSDRIRPHELPSGEQQILVLFGELIRRLKPGAIVMIDELEISLHPALQRVVLYHLRRLAKLHDLQIILTTHSLEIVAAADPSEIVNLDDMVFTEFAARTDEAAE